ncbi:hypothetical protein BE221DRAFT_63307, partial [Ostreococcus tauri]
TSWSILFTHTINAFGHSAGTSQYAGTYQEIPGTHLKQSYSHPLARARVVRLFFVIFSRRLGAASRRCGVTERNLTY